MKLKAKSAFFTSLLLFNSTVFAYVEMCSEEIRNTNMVMSATHALIGGLISQSIESWTDIVATAGVGALSGYGFYEAKVAMGEGDYKKGILLTHLSRSAVSNISVGEWPFRSFIAGVSGIDFRYVLPSKQEPIGSLIFEPDWFNLLTTTRFMQYSENFSIQEGILYGEGKIDEIFDVSFADGDFTAAGIALGSNIMYNPAYSSHYDDIRPHEAIHVVQYYQQSSARVVHWEDTRAFGSVLDFDYMTAGLTGFYLSLANMLFGGGDTYAESYAEREAYNLSARTQLYFSDDSSSRLPEMDCLHPTLKFEFRLSF